MARLDEARASPLGRDVIMPTNHLDLNAEEWQQYKQVSQESGTIRWFGPDWHAPINRPETQIEPPVGVSCSECGKLVEDGQRGVAIPALSKQHLSVYHHGCFMLTVLGPGWQGMMLSAGADPHDFD